MNRQEAEAIAVKYGAKLGRATSCWIDRIAWLPIAAERGPQALVDAIIEANRYA